METNHEMVLWYTTDDDGIHLRCTCGEDICLGFDPKVHEVVAANAKHLADAGVQQQRRDPNRELK